jgi:uncharacterized protein YfkK (UPF0435 family)
MMIENWLKDVKSIWDYRRNDLVYLYDFIEKVNSSDWKWRIRQSSTKSFCTKWCRHLASYVSSPQRRMMVEYIREKLLPMIYSMIAPSSNQSNIHKCDQYNENAVHEQFHDHIFEIRQLKIFNQILVLKDAIHQDCRSHSHEEDFFRLFQRVLPE